MDRPLPAAGVKVVVHSSPVHMPLASEPLVQAARRESQQLGWFGLLRTAGLTARVGVFQVADQPERGDDYNQSRGACKEQRNGRWLQLVVPENIASATHVPGPKSLSKQPHGDAE